MRQFLPRKGDAMIRTHLPAIDELAFRQRMLADPRTMSYNRAWGGTIPFPEADWPAWYRTWVQPGGKRRYYRYLMLADGTFVGEIAYHFDPKWGGCMANVIIFSAYRGKGYGRAGLRLLCRAAAARGETVLYDDIAIDNPAKALFLQEGFAEIARTDRIILLKKELSGGLS